MTTACFWIAILLAVGYLAAAVVLIGAHQPVGDALFMAGFCTLSAFFCADRQSSS